MQSIKTYTNKATVLLYLFVYYLIIGSDCILFCYNRNETMVDLGQYFMVLVAIVFAVLALGKNKHRVKKKYIVLTIILLSIVMTAIYHGEFSGGYISLIALFTLGATFFDVIDPRQFKKAFLDIMTLICGVSLITYVFSSIFLELPFFPSVYNNMGYEYRFFFFSNIAIRNVVRNYGLFTEPSRFQAYINLGLIFLLFEREKKPDLRRIVLFIITLITTLSTTGFVAFAIILIAFILSPDLKIKSSFKAVMVAFLAIAVGVLFYGSADFAWAIQKFSAGDDSASAATRFNSLYANLRLIVDYFPFGTGIQSAEQAFNNTLEALGHLEASTNTITVLIYFAKFGLVPGLYYVCNMIKSISRIGGIKSTVLLVAAFIAMTSGITMVESIIFSIIVFYPSPNKMDSSEDLVDESVGIKHSFASKRGGKV